MMKLRDEEPQLCAADVFLTCVLLPDGINKFYLKKSQNQENLNLQSIPTKPTV